MPFPPSERVIYKKNPLNEVVCQLRFPPILRIDSDSPSQFQERIRKEYPLLKERAGKLPQEILQQLPPAIVNSALGSGGRIYDFISEDENWVVSLARDFLALTAKNYERWEYFRDHLQSCLIAFEDEYSPAFFSRVGLRYQNVIRRSKLGLENNQWANLLESHIVGILASPEHEITESVDEIFSQVVLKLKETPGQVRMQYGLVQVQDEINGETETCFLIDNDFFTSERTETSDALDILSTYSRKNGKLFRWCITEQLHSIMGPQKIE
jgi:uncharacterized protein (TIGR04255 family)